MTPIVAIDLGLAFLTGVFVGAITVALHLTAKHRRQPPKVRCAPPPAQAHALPGICPLNKPPPRPRTLYPPVLWEN